MDSSSKDDPMYDVFLSSGGEDTRRTFTDHLYCALEDDRFNVFMYGDEYDYKLEKSNRAIPEHLIQEIERSKVAIVVFSRGYPESAWCLEELVKIIECRKTLGQIFFPIFYGVDSSDVLNQSGSFAPAFQKYEQEVKEEKVLLWRSALKEAGSLAGLNFRYTDGVGTNSAGNEGNFIRNVVSQITEKLSRNSRLVVPTKLFGIDSRMREISEHLDVGGSNDVRIIGILGMCGLGKTTVAKAVFNKHHHSFDGASFLETASEEKLVDLQKKLLSDILKPAYILVSSIGEGTKEIEQRLGNRRVLVVIDDLDSVQQRDALAIKPGSFGRGSRIIITSRNEHLLKILNVDKICPLPAMNEREAFELLSWHAFRNNYPNGECIELLRKAVGYCGGLPLALEVLGSYIRTESTSEWETVLDKWKRSQPYREIHRRLEISYDGLTDDDVKAIFLDISCFFTGMNKDYVMTVLDGCQFYPEIGIRELQDQCLVTVDIEGNLMMHDLIQGMGREIVRAESPDNPGQRSRLWHNEDITDVLTKQSGTEDLEGLTLDMQESDECSFSTEAFRKMQNLRLLKLNNIKLTGSYDNLSKELRWLCWHGFPLEVIPKDFDQPNLVAVDLSYSKLIRVWEDTDVLLKNLKIINLSHSHYLTELPDFSKVPNLEELILANCRKLSQIHPSIGHLERLSLVNLEDCKTLQYFPRGFYKSRSVETLILKGCSDLKRLDDRLGGMVSLTTLQAHQTRIRKVPSSIVRLKNLTFLGLRSCNITDDSIPKDLGSLFSLEILELDGNLFCSLPSLSGLSKLKMLDLSYCKDLLEIPDLPRSLEILRANHCFALAKLPNFSEMSSMVELHLNLSPKLTEILGLHKSLNTMRRIHMEGCTNLTAAFRKNILQGWTSCGNGDIFLNGIYDIPEWFQFVDIREPNDVHFKVPQIIGRNFRGLTVCCIFETCCPGFTVTNITKGKALHIWEESTCWEAALVLRLQSVLSNDVLHLQSGDEVSISAVTEAQGTGRVMKTGVNLVWDDGDGSDAYSGNDEIVAVPSNTSSDEPEENKRRKRRSRPAGPMLGDSTSVLGSSTSRDAAASTSVLGSSTSRDAAAVAVAAPEGGGGDGSNNNSGEEAFRGGHEELSGGGERSFGGNRWPRQETLALLQIRSDIRDASVKGPLWEEVSRVSEQQQNQNQNQHQSTPNQSQLLPLQPAPLPPPRKPAPPLPQAQPQQTAINIDIVLKSNNNGENDNLMTSPSSSRWPKVEVQALIKLRTSLDSKYQENGPKGPLWEEISGAMRKLGYSRNAKRCKEKWENINKYFKRVKESNKKRPEDSKTFLYFDLLDSLYRERNRFDQNNVNSTSPINSSSQFKPENSVPLMVRPEQQWPPQPPPPHQQDHQGLLMGINHHQNQGDDHHDQQDIENNIGDDDDEEEDGEEEEDYDDGDGNYEIVANKPAPVGAATAE